MPWGVIIAVAYVLVALDHHGTWEHLAGWKKLYLVVAGLALALFFALDALTRRRS